MAARSFLRTQNVVRTAGGAEDPDAVLLSAHYDSTPRVLRRGGRHGPHRRARGGGSPGARASGPPLESTVSSTSTAPEELLPLRRRGFLRRRWARDVRSSSTSRRPRSGRAVHPLPGGAWPDAVAAGGLRSCRAAPPGERARPGSLRAWPGPGRYGWWRVRQAGLPGWTSRSSRVCLRPLRARPHGAARAGRSPGTSGDNAPRGRRALAGQPLRAPEAGAPPVFFDVLGRWFVVYRASRCRRMGDRGGVARHRGHLPRRAPRAGGTRADRRGLRGRAALLDARAAAAHRALARSPLRPRPATRLVRHAVARCRGLRRSFPGRCAAATLALAAAMGGPRRTRGATGPRGVDRRSVGVDLHAGGGAGRRARRRVPRALVGAGRRARAGRGLQRPRVCAPSCSTRAGRPGCCSPWALAARCWTYSFLSRAGSRSHSRRIR